MAEIIDLLEYKRKKDEEELEQLHAKVKELTKGIVVYPPEYIPQPQNFDYGQSWYSEYASSSYLYDDQHGYSFFDLWDTCKEPKDDEQR